jgi:hypothetical protein
MNIPSRPQPVRTQYSTGNVVSDYVYDMHVHRYREAHSQYTFARTQMIYAERDMAIERENIRLLAPNQQLHPPNNASATPIQRPRRATNTSNIHASDVDNTPASILNWRNLIDNDNYTDSNTPGTYRRRGQGWNIFGEPPLHTNTENVENNIDANTDINTGNQSTTNLMNSHINTYGQPITIPTTQINTGNQPITLPYSGPSRTLEFSIPLSLFNNIPTSPERTTVDRATINRATRVTVYSQLENPINDTCGIALTRFQPNDFVRQIIYCGHVFMNRELMRWFERSSICPTCRHDLRTEIGTNVRTNSTVNSINRNTLNIIDIASEPNDTETVEETAEETDEEEAERAANSMIELVESIIDQVNEINAIENIDNIDSDNSDNDDDDSVEDIDT